ncbi:testis-specific serine/threonine-protein kinase 2-like [Babylonia areolata]|uniref:testis-specific serine/threonine-protein kinase 2-like n=1 Tax=Babylonia areolata TaxID=304850 RepID=UPI003FD5D115
MEYVCDVSLWAGLLQEHGYDLLGQLDSGSFSEVFAVRSRTSRRVLAVKRMVARREISTDPRVLKEISCLKQLSFRGACVIRLEGTIWKLDRLACLLLELAPMGDLERHAAERWPLSAQLVTGAVRQVLSALTHCHRLHIAHRDVNPANVLLMSERSVRLADFGLAFHCRDSQSGRRLLCEDYLGRDAYLAPEVLVCRPYDALQADMWSVSSLCVFMLTGKHPPPPRPPSLSDDDYDDDERPSALETGSPPGRTPAVCQPHPHSSVRHSPFAAAHNKRNPRHSSHDSEGSWRSESDLEEPLALSTVPDPESDCVTPRSSCGEDCPWEGEADHHIHCASHGLVDDVFRKPTAADCAVVRLVSKLRVENPADRLKAEDTLTLWKNISKSVGFS